MTNAALKEYYVIMPYKPVGLIGNSTFFAASHKEDKMPKQRLLQMLTVVMILGVVSSASAATTLKKLARSPFYRPGVSSAADLKNLVKARTADLQAGFTKAGYQDLYPSFMEQFPTAKIVSIKVSPGETFTWMLFKRKKNGQVAVLKDVTWGGAAPFDAYLFDIDKDGKRYEFLVPAVCGNVTLRNIAMVPPPPAPVTQLPAAAPAPPVIPAPVATPAPPPPAPTPAPVAAPAPPPVTPAPVAAPAPPPIAAAPKAAPAPPPVAAAPKATVAPPPIAPTPVVAPAPPVAKPLVGLLVDVGVSRERDPANYAFARVGYELPLTRKLYLMGLVGGYLRWWGHDGGSAFTADAMLDYHWLGRTSFGLGAGYWSGRDGQLDLLANLGFRLFGAPDRSNSTLFLELRLPADNLEDSYKIGRFGLGMRFRF